MKTKESLVELVDRQFVAFNEKNIERFCASFAEDVVVNNMTTNEPPIRGMADFWKHHAELFAQFPKSQARLLGRTQQGNFLFDQEEIIGMGEEPLRLTVVYEMGDKAIQQLWIFI